MVIATEMSTTQTAALVVAFGVVIVSLFYCRRLVRRREGAGWREGSDGPPRRQRPVPSALEESSERLVLELQELGRELEGRLDTKIHHLQRLVSEADKLADRLSKLMARAEEEVGERARSAQGYGPSRPRVDPRRAEVETLARSGLDARAIAERTGLPAGEVELILNLMEPHVQEER